MVVTDILWMVILFLIPGMVSFTVYRYVAGYAIDRLYKFILYSTIWAILAYGIVEVIGYFMYGIPIGNNSDVWIVFGISLPKFLFVQCFMHWRRGVSQLFLSVV